MQNYVQQKSQNFANCRGIQHRFTYGIPLHFAKLLSLSYSTRNQKIYEISSVRNFVNTLPWSVDTFLGKGLHGKKYMVNTFFYLFDPFTVLTFAASVILSLGKGLVNEIEFKTLTNKDTSVV